MMNIRVIVILVMKINSCLQRDSSDSHYYTNVNNASNAPGVKILIATEEWNAINTRKMLLIFYNAPFTL